jgi:anti-sigma-K factor RskA
MTKEEFSELSAAFALGALNADERERFARTLAANPEWAAMVDDDLSIAAALADAAPDEPVRAQVKASLLSRLDALIDGGEPPSALRDSWSQTDLHPAPPEPVDELARGTAFSDEHVAEEPLARRHDEHDEDDDDVRRPRHRFGLRVLATVAIFALIGGLGSGLFSALQPERPASEVALEQIAAAPDAQTAATNVAGGGQAAVTWSADQGQAVLQTAGLDPAPSGHTYELWFVRGDEKIAAGTFDPGSRGEAQVLVAGEMHAGDVIAVTVEVTGGSPNGVPSDQVVFALPTSPAGNPT